MRVLRLIAVILLFLAPSIAQAASGSYAATAGSGLTFAADNDASSHLVAEVGLCQAAAGTSGTCGAVKAASTAAVAGDPSIVMQLSPNSLGGASGTPLFADITNSSIAVTGTFWQATQPVSLASLPAFSNSSTVTIGKVDNLGNAGAIIDFAGQNATAPANSWLVGCGYNLSPTTITSGNASPLGCDSADNLQVNIHAGQGTVAGSALYVQPGTSAIFEVAPTTSANTATNPFFDELTDGTHTNTIKAASTQSAAADTSQVVQINPNQPNLTTALNVSAAPTTATAWGIFTNGSTTSGQSGALGMCATTTSAPTNTNAQTNWIDCTTAGALRTDMASVAGTATSTAASGVQKVGIVGNAAATIDAALGSASTNAVTVQGASGMTAVNTLAQADTAATNSGYAYQVSSTPTVTASAYSSGNCLGGFNSITVAGNNAQSGFVTNFQVWSKTGLTPTITVYLFEANPSSSTCTDHGTFTLATADLPKMIGLPQQLTLSAPTGATPSVAEAFYNSADPFLAGASGSSVKTIYYAMVAGGAFTPGSTSEFVTRTGVLMN